jgi:hypothetical protein
MNIGASNQKMKVGNQKVRRACSVLRSLASILCLFAFVLGMMVPFARADVPKEYQIKAAFVYNFAKFVEWPPNRFASPTAPIVICVFGKNPFGSELDNIVKGRKINGRNILVRQLNSIEEARDAHIVFFSGAEDHRVAKLLEALRGRGILTIGESSAFGSNSGMIQFLLDADKVRFEINTDAAEADGLKINAQLLKLATEVRRKK